MVVHFRFQSRSASPIPPRRGAEIRYDRGVPLHPVDRAEAAARAAQRRVEEAQLAADAAREASAEASERAPPTVSVDSLSLPPPPNAHGERYFYARSDPHLEDGIYMTLALKNRGLDPDKPAPGGVLAGYKTE